MPCHALPPRTSPYARLLISQPEGEFAPQACCQYGDELGGGDGPPSGLGWPMNRLSAIGEGHQDRNVRRAGRCSRKTDRTRTIRWEEAEAIVLIRSLALEPVPTSTLMPKRLLVAFVALATGREHALVMASEAISKICFWYVTHRRQRLGMWLVAPATFNNPFAGGMRFAGGELHRGMWIHDATVVEFVFL
jgi:hypothetical protein